MEIPQFFDLQLVMIAGFSCAVLLVVLILLIARYRIQSRELALQAAEIRPLSQKVQKVDQELKFVVQFIRELPYLTGELNTPSKPRGMYEVLLNILGRVFQPQQAVVLVRRRPTLVDPNQDQELTVAAVQVPTNSLASGVQFKVSEGPFGHVAQAERVLERSDFDTGRSGIGVLEGGSRQAGMRIDLAAPMKVGDEMMGVLAIEAPQKQQQHSKEVLWLIAQMGAFAIRHAKTVTTIQSVADVDALTGISNKKVLHFRLSELVNDVEQGKRKGLAVFIFDIDYFKHYNDTNGHIAGDELLRTLARVAKAQIRQEDIFGRFGGEEFLLILPDRTSEEGLIVGTKVRMAIESYDFAKGENQPGGRLTVSGGVASLPECASDSTALLQAADQALYRAKEGGRNKVIVAPPQVQIGATEQSA